jgi:hypothetical protein
MRDREMAYRWALAAADKRPDEATISIRDSVAADLAPAVRARIERDMQIWRPEHQPRAWIIFIPDIEWFTIPIEIMASIFLGLEPCYPVLDPV